jgi:hypothetical protein
MSQDTLKFKGSLSNGVTYELHEAVGFSDRAEIALKIGGEVSTVIVVDHKRTGSIICRPVQTRTVTIKKIQELNTISSKPNLKDVV